MSWLQARFKGGKSAIEYEEASLHGGRWWLQSMGLTLVLILVCIDTSIEMDIAWISHGMLHV